MATIEQAGAAPAAVMISLDRQERGAGSESAIAEIRRRHELSVHSIVTLINIIEFLEETGGFASEISAIRDYHHEFGS